MFSLLAAIAGFVALVLAFIFSALPPPDAMHAAAQRRSGNFCASAYYPASAVRAGEQGATLLNVSLSKTGTITKVEVVQSSGFADLDKASVDCVTSEWHFRPAMQNGVPVASAKKYRIVWKLMSGGNVAPRLQTPVAAACASDFPASESKWSGYRSAALHFRIFANGTVSHPFIAASSGDSSFDAKALQCATHLTYAAAQIDGAPTDVSWNAAIDWSPHTGLAFADGYKLGVFCFDRDFPAKIWNGDPANSTVISFHLVQDGTTANAAIEQASGNPALDQAALECIRGWRPPYRPAFGPAADRAEAVRFDWKDGHAFQLSDTWK